MEHKAPFPIIVTQFVHHINKSSILQLINGVSNALQKLIKYYNGTANFPSSFFLFAPSATGLPIILTM